MVILDLDAGNTRLKWRLLDNSSIVGQGAVLTVGTDGAALDREFDLFERVPDRVRVSSVRDAGFNSELADRIRGKWSVEPEFAKVALSCAGLTNSYKDVSRMGVDRWMAMLAAFHMTQGGCCVVGAGSALTVDFVSADGVHQGGYIVPGLQLMLDSLQKRSSALNYESLPTWEITKPGASTVEAMEHGILDLVISWLRALHLSHGECEWVITGGDASALVAHLDWPLNHQPVLVLDGLSLALP